MIHYEYDDGGRAAAGRKGKTGDCVTRALAILTGWPYVGCYKALAEANYVAETRKRKQKRKPQRSASNGVLPEAYEPVFRDFGLVKVPLPPGPKPTYSEAHERYGNCIVGTVGHLCCLKDGALRDTFDGRIYDATAYGGNAETERKARSVWVEA